MNMGNIKTFDQYIEEMYKQEEQFPDELFDMTVEIKAAQMLVSLTKTVKTDSHDITGWSVIDSLIKETMKAIKGVDGFQFAGDGFDREEDDKGGFTIVANIKLLYNIHSVDDDVDLNAVFSGMSSDVEVAISEVQA